ncbi:hypothetical protein cyc_07730 [Cyclospora cayetanensis]|uniref:Uncharacterized protein n=1 Tax=Cyclospora cayetanensis TaxID=88456 RepID=A0A1D3CQR7_9EIME|nr:hypothetical protein cyc_07730 [Cyclospora cayetanensis]
MERDRHRNTLTCCPTPATPVGCLPTKTAADCPQQLHFVWPHLMLQRESFLDPPFPAGGPTSVEYSATPVMAKAATAAGKGPSSLLLDI